MLNTLHRDGWRPKAEQRYSVPALTGKAIAAGLGFYNNLRTMPETNLDVDRSGVIKAVGEFALEHFNTDVKMTEPVINVTETERGRVIPVLENYIKNDPLRAYKVVAVELDYGAEYGYARPDLVIEDEFGLAAVDYKTSAKPIMRRTYEESFQMKHYCHFGQYVFNRPIQRYLIVGLNTYAVSNTPQVERFDAAPEKLDLWYQATVPVWQHMKKVEDGVVKPWMAAEHEDKWGPCEMKRACLDFRLDEGLMRREYVKLERSKDVV